MGTITGWAAVLTEVAALVPIMAAAAVAIIYAWRSSSKPGA